MVHLAIKKEVITVTERVIPSAEGPVMPTDTALCDEPFVVLRDGEDFAVRLQYPQKDVHHATPTCYLRREVYRRLLQAQQALPHGWRLCIWDGWRPFALQQELYDTCAQEIVQKYGLTDAAPEQQRQAVARFVSFPRSDRRYAPAHTTGGAVDLTLVDAAGAELDMGTVFDEFTDRARTDYYETCDEDDAIRMRRRVLFHCMQQAGFTNLPSEWWHYDFGDGYWAHYRQQPIRYAGVFTEEELNVE